jgi:hypothetical protein
MHTNILLLLQHFWISLELHMIQLYSCSTTFIPTLASLVWLLQQLVNWRERETNFVSIHREALHRFLPLELVLHQFSLHCFLKATNAIQQTTPVDVFP